MKNNDVFYLQSAYKESLIAFLNNNVPVGCVITDKKSVLIKEKNKKSKEKNKFYHAEVECLKKIEKNKLNSLFLYTTLIPCPMCSGTIFMYNLKKIYIGTRNNVVLYNEICEKLLKNRIKKYFLSKKCSKILNSFFFIRR